MKETLGIHIPVKDVSSLCGDIEVKNSMLCFDAYAAVNGDKEAEERIKQFIISTNILLTINAPPELLDELLKLLVRANARQLIEVYAPTTSTAQFILLLRALASGDRDLALLHAEVGRAELSGFVVGKLFDGLVDALKRSNEDEVKLAIAKLYYLHF